MARRRTAGWDWASTRRGTVNNVEMRVRQSTVGSLTRGAVNAIVHRLASGLLAGRRAAPHAIERRLLICNLSRYVEIVKTEVIKDSLTDAFEQKPSDILQPFRACGWWRGSGSMLTAGVGSLRDLSGGHESLIRKANSRRIADTHGDYLVSSRESILVVRSPPSLSRVMLRSFDHEVPVHFLNMRRAPVSRAVFFTALGALTPLVSLPNPCSWHSFQANHCWS